MLETTCTGRDNADSIMRQCCIASIELGEAPDTDTTLAQWSGAILEAIVDGTAGNWGGHRGRRCSPGPAGCSKAVPAATGTGGALP